MLVDSRQVALLELPRGATPRLDARQNQASTAIPTRTRPATGISDCLRPRLKRGQLALLSLPGAAPDPR